jgi:hypothetical protein
MFHLFFNENNKWIQCYFFPVPSSLTIYAYAIEKQKEFESKLDSFNLIKLYFFRCLHYIVFVAVAFYPFLADKNPKYDFWLLGVLVLILLHWPIFGECVLDIVEKHVLYQGKLNLDSEKMTMLGLINVPSFITDLPDTIIIIPIIMLILRICREK